MRHATVLAAGLLAFSASASLAGDLTDEMKAAARKTASEKQLPPLEEMKAAAVDAWANYHRGEINHQLTALNKAQRDAVQLITQSLTENQKTKFADVVSRADKFSGTVIPAGQKSIENLNMHVLLPWYAGLKKGKPAFDQNSIDDGQKTFAFMDENDRKWECEYYGWELEKCKKFVDDNHQQWLAYDAKLKEMVLELTKSNPDDSKKWAKVGNDLSLESFRKAHKLIEANLEEAKAVSGALLGYARAHDLIKSSETTSSR